MHSWHLLLHRLLHLLVEALIHEVELVTLRLLIHEIKGVVWVLSRLAHVHACKHVVGLWLLLIVHEVKSILLLLLRRWAAVSTKKIEEVIRLFLWSLVYRLRLRLGLGLLLGYLISLELPVSFRSRSEPS